MKISVDELNALAQKRLRLSYSEALPVDGAVKPVVGELSIAGGVGGVRLTGHVKTLLKLTCQTCLRPYFQSIAVELDEQFSSRAYADEESQKEKELTRDDFYEVLPADGILDIDDIVYQAVTLACPVYCRCGDDCPGPPKAQKAAVGGALEPEEGDGGAPEMIDPRWKNLKSLFPKADNEENS
ncbi:MAG: DUF177 domain-containing protein [Candidatus Melainabacteria bacterium]|nr:DUF177 domain-containing protein [Candidatus Melainabacteria bacterium]